MDPFYQMVLASAPSQVSPLSPGPAHTMPPLCEAILTLQFLLLRVLSSVFIWVFEEVMTQTAGAWYSSIESSGAREEPRATSATIPSGAKLGMEGTASLVMGWI